MVIRDAEVTDARELLELMVKIDSETHFMLFEEGERKLDVQRQEKAIEAVSANQHLNLLVALDSARIVGYLGLTQLQQRRVNHIAKLVCGVTRSVWGKGVGRQLLAAALYRAKVLGVSRVELTVVKENERARKLYEKNGFKVEGERKRAMLIDGRYHDELYMSFVVDDATA